MDNNTSGDGDTGEEPETLEDSSVDEEDAGWGDVEELVQQTTVETSQERQRFLLSVCGESGNKGFTPQLSDVAARIARSIGTGPSACYGIYEISDRFVKVTNGRCNAIKLNDLADIVAVELRAIGRMLDECGPEPGAFLYAVLIPSDDGGEPDVRYRDNHWYTNRMKDFIAGTPRIVDDVTKLVSRLLPKKRLFDDFMGGPGAGGELFAFHDKIVITDWAGGLATRDYLPEDRLMGTFPFNWEGETSDLMLRWAHEICGGDAEIALDLLSGISEGFCLRDKEVALYLYGEETQEGKSLGFKFLSRMFGDRGMFNTEGAMRGAVLSDRSILFGKNENHPSGTLNLVNVSAALVNDIGDTEKINSEAVVMFVAPGGKVSARQMGMAFIDGIEIPIRCTFFMQGNSLLSLNSLQSKAFVNRRILGFYCTKISNRLRDEMIAVLGDPDEREKAVRGLAHACLPLIRGITWKGSEASRAAWQELLLERTPYAESEFAKLGIEYTGDMKDLVYCTTMYKVYKDTEKADGWNGSHLNAVLRAWGYGDLVKKCLLSRPLRASLGTKYATWLEGFRMKRRDVRTDFPPDVLDWVAKNRDK